jgi:hypothetical protein
VLFKQSVANKPFILDVILTIVILSVILLSVMAPRQTKRQSYKTFFIVTEEKARPFFPLKFFQEFLVRSEARKEASCEARGEARGEVRGEARGEARGGARGEAWGEA